MNKDIFLHNHRTPITHSGHFTMNDAISSVQSPSRVRLFATPWITARQASLSITNSWSSLKLMSIESVMPSSHLILCRPLLLTPPIPTSIRVFSNESTLHEVAKVLEFQLHISPSNEHPIIPLIALIAIFIFYFVFNCYFSFVFLCFNLVSNQGPCIVIIRHNFLGFPNSQDVP